MGLLSSGAKAAAKNAVSDAGLLSPGIRAYHGSPEGAQAGLLSAAKNARTWFHGSSISDNPIRDFDPSMLGSSSGAKDAKEGFYFGGKRSTAEAYLEEGDILPPEFVDEYDRLAKPAQDLEDSLKKDYPIPAEATNKEKMEVMRQRIEDPRYDEARKLRKPAYEFMMKHSRPGKYGSITEAQLDMKDPLIVDFQGEPWDEARQMSVIKEAKEQGHDGVVFQNMQDSGWFGGSGADDIALVFDPKSIKTINAISNKYGVGPVAAAAIAAGTMTPEQAQAGPLSAAAKRAIQKGYTKDVYHGTTQDFDQIDPDAVDLGVHVGTPAQAKNRLLDTADSGTRGRFAGVYDEGASIMPLKARMNKTLHMPDVGDWKNSYDVLVGLRNTPIWRKNSAKIQDLEEYADEIQGQYYGSDEMWRDSPENREILDEINTMLSDSGYDSIMYRNDVENAYGSYAGLTPAAEQRKAAISREINALDQEVRSRLPQIPEGGDPDFDANLAAYIAGNPDQVITPAEAARRAQLLDESRALSSDPANQADQNSYIILDPDANLRSKNAQFVGERGNLLASVGTGLGVGIGASFTPEEAQAGFLTTPANLIRIGMLKPQSAQNPSAVKSAMTKYDKAMRDNKAFRFREKIRADVENQTQSIDIGERNILDFSDLVGKVGVPVAGDTSITGKILQTIGGQNLDMPVGVEGGSNFGLRYADQGFGWASMEDAAKKKQKNFALAAEQTNGMQPVGIFNAMGREAVNFSTPPAETMLQQARALPIKKSDIKAFDDELRKSRPDWVGLNHPGAMDQIMGRGEYPQKGAGKLRSEFVQEMSKARHRDVGFPIKEDVHSEILQPEIADLPIGSSGFSMFDAQPGASVISGSPHQSYDTIIPGQYIGGLDQSVPARVMFPKTFADLDQRINKAGKPFTEQQKTGSLVMDPKLYEVFDDQWADGMYQYLRGAGNKQRGSATPAAMAAAGGAGLLGAQAMQAEPTLADYGIGLLDAAANAGAAMIAPIANAPHTLIQSLTSDIPTDRIDASSQARLQSMDYQPRTQLGQQMSDEGLQILRGLLAPAMPLVEPITTLFGQLPRRAQLVGESLLDMSPL